MTTATDRPALTAAQAIVVAAADLAAAGAAEFSEWDLTVAAWARDRERFGLRGYAQAHPDHKRVTMEIMGSKASNPVGRKYLERTRPNHYRLTPLGLTVAARLRADPAPPRGSRVTVADLYAAAAALVSRSEFRRWQDNPEEPREWAAAAASLGLTGGEPKAAAGRRAAEVHAAARAGVDWCNAREVAILPSREGSRAGIHVRDLADVADFIQALRYRFPDRLA